MFVYVIEHVSFDNKLTYIKNFKNKNLKIIKKCIKLEQIDQDNF